MVLSQWCQQQRSVRSQSINDDELEKFTWQQNVKVSLSSQSLNTGNIVNPEAELKLENLCTPGVGVGRGVGRQRGRVGGEGGAVGGVGGVVVLDHADSWGLITSSHVITAKHYAGKSQAKMSFL